MITTEVEVSGTFEVTIDESKVTPEFLQEFSDTYFYVDSVDDLILHLAQLFGRGVVDNDTKFIEGFGPVEDFGISFKSTYGRSWIDNSVEVEVMTRVKC